MKGKAVKTVLGYSLAIFFWVIVLYFLYPYWEWIIITSFAAGWLAYVLLICIGMLFLIIVLPLSLIIDVVKERNALRKKVEELEERIG